eukprot:TRINITY_DN13833_c0_g5_i1.p1 TRINITY_DN13833_c0_g5~~TRINITY_DN13833_c0_g5_i1.p1  ORF type:complete len:912 (+),score=220.83 TRINITY_DN13833_c0_g5_i1:87-2738(+)
MPAAQVPVNKQSPRGLRGMAGRHASEHSSDGSPVTYARGGPKLSMLPSMSSVSSIGVPTPVSQAGAAARRGSSGSTSTSTLSLSSKVPPLATAAVAAQNAQVGQPHPQGRRMSPGQASPRQQATHRLSGTFGNASPLTMSINNGRPGSASTKSFGSPRILGAVPAPTRRVDPNVQGPPSPGPSRPGSPQSPHSRRGAASPITPMNPLRRPTVGSPSGSPRGSITPGSPRASTGGAASADATMKLQWKRGKFLGSGAFGKVFLGLNLATGRLMAVKTIEFAAADKDIISKLQGLQQEIKMMKGLQHENIVEYYFTERQGFTINIFMEFVPGGSLSSVLEEFGPLSEGTAQNYLRQIVLALEYLHTHGVIHRDIKAANVLLNVHGVCKLSDFGTASKIDDMRKQGGNAMLGTPAWMAPEVIKEEPSIGKPSDIWSLAATCLEVLTAKQPFAHITTNTLKLMAALASDEMLVLPTFEFAALNGFLQACLQKDPSLRPSSSDLLQNYDFFFIADEASDGFHSDDDDEPYDDPNADRLSQSAFTNPHNSPNTNSLRAPGPGIMRNVSDVNSTGANQLTPPLGHVQHDGGSFGNYEEGMDTMSMPNTEVISRPGEQDDLMSPTSPQLRGSPRTRWSRRRMPGSTKGGLTVDVAASVVSSKRSFIGSTVVGGVTTSRSALTRTPVNPQETARIGKHLLGSCISLMSIVPRVDKEKDDTTTNGPGDAASVTPSRLSHSHPDSRFDLRPGESAGDIAGLGRSLIIHDDETAAGDDGDDEEGAEGLANAAAAGVDVETEILGRLTSHTFQEAAPCVVSRVDAPWDGPPRLSMEDVEFGRQMHTQSITDSDYDGHESYFFCCTFMSVEKTKSVAIFLLSLLSLTLGILLTLKSM